MSMSVQVLGRLALFRIPEEDPTPPATTWNEARIDDRDKVNIDAPSNTWDPTVGLITHKYVMSRWNTSNAAPYSEESKKPDVGFSGIRLELKLVFNEMERKSKAINTLGRWFIEANTIPGKFREGRVGIRNNYRSEFNLLPVYTSGWKVAHFEIFTEMLYHNLPTGFLIMTHSGMPQEFTGLARPPDPPPGDPPQ